MEMEDVEFTFKGSQQAYEQMFQIPYGQAYCFQQIQSRSVPSIQAINDVLSSLPSHPQPLLTGSASAPVQAVTPGREAVTQQVAYAPTVIDIASPTYFESQPSQMFVPPIVAPQKGELLNLLGRSLSVGRWIFTRSPWLLLVSLSLYVGVQVAINPGLGTNSIEDSAGSPSPPSTPKVSPSPTPKASASSTAGSGVRAGYSPTIIDRLEQQINSSVVE